MYDSDDDNDETEDYIYSPPLTKPPNEDAERFWLRIGHKLKDTDDDTCFKVIGVCSSDEYDELFYAYYDIDKYGSDPPDDVRLWEYTPCREMLKSGRGAWVEWEDAIVTEDAAHVSGKSAHSSATQLSLDHHTQPPSTRRPTYDYVPRNEWRDTGGINASNVIAGRRRRS